MTERKENNMESINQCCFSYLCIYTSFDVYNKRD